MKKSLPIVIILLALSLTIGIAPGSAAQQQTGGYQKAPKDDPPVVAAAKFAVSDQQTKQGGTVELVSIKRAETELVSGINYRLCLRVKVNGKTQTVTTIVNKTLDDRHTLTSWETGGCKKATSTKPVDKKPDAKTTER
jgi:Aspartic acid proteinase inhibitor